MTEIIHDNDSSNNGLLAVILIVVIAIGGFLLWRYARTTEPKTPDIINVQVTPPAPTTN
jgi:hypothetical protein